MIAKIAIVVILFCLVVAVYFSGITGFFLAEDEGENTGGPKVSVKDFREPGEHEVTGGGADTGPGEEEDTPDEGADQYYGGGGGGGSSGQPECYRDSDCGTDGWEDPYCSGNEIYQDMVMYECANPGALNSYCSVKREPELKGVCETCYDGECVEERAEVFVSPENSEAGVGEEFTANVDIESEYYVFAAEFELRFDPDVLEVLSVEEGEYLRQDGASIYPLMIFDNDAGIVNFAVTRFNVHTGVSGPGTLCIVKFSGVSAGSSGLDLQEVSVTDFDINLVPVSIFGGAASIS
jgi:hypothetical protein